MITEAYRAQQQALHKDPEYGVASLSFAPLVAEIITGLKCRSLSDYGAGKQNLRRALEAAGVAVEYRPYDPAFPEYGPPQAADLVCCIDVLEHIEPDCLDEVLRELRQITTGAGFFTIHTGPARKFLPDGRNAHLIQQSATWWLDRIGAFFTITESKVLPDGCLLMVA